jgi:hypothetical protein
MFKHMFDAGPRVQTALGHLAAAQQELAALDLATLSGDQLLELMAALAVVNTCGRGDDERTIAGRFGQDETTVLRWPEVSRTVGSAGGSHLGGAAIRVAPR